MLECTFTPSIINTEKTVGRDPKNVVNQLYQEKRRGRRVENVDVEGEHIILNRSLEYRGSVEKRME